MCYFQGYTSLCVISRGYTSLCVISRGYGSLCVISRVIPHYVLFPGVIARSGYWLVYWRPHHLNQVKDLTSHLPSAIGAAVVEVHSPSPSVSQSLTLFIELGLFLVHGYLLLDFFLCCGCVQLQIWWKVENVVLSCLHLVFLFAVYRRLSCFSLVLPSLPQVSSCYIIISPLYFSLFLIFQDNSL